MAQSRKTREQWAALVAEYEQSGLSNDEFAKQRGLKARTFAWWRSALKRDEPRVTGRRRRQQPVEEVRALPVTLIDDQGRSGGEAIEVAFGDVRLCVPAGTDAVYLGQIVLELRSLC
jgi:hypothetical protein